MGVVRCSGCGAEHGDGSALAKVGWQADGAGGALHLALCYACGSRLTIARLEGASFCAGCKRLLHREVKLCTEAGVLCLACARRSHGIPLGAFVVRRTGATR